MATNILTDSTYFTEAVGRYYVKRGLERLLPELHLYKLAKKYPLPKQNSPYVYFHKMVELTEVAHKLVQGTSPTQQPMLSVTGVNATVQQSGNWAQVSELVDLTAIEPAVEMATDTLTEQIAFTIDKRILYALMGSNTGEGFSPENLDSAGETARATLVHFSQLFAGKNTDLSCLFISSDGRQVQTVTAFNEALSGAGDTTVAAVKGFADDWRLTGKRINYVVGKLRAQNAKPFEDGLFAGVAHPYVLQDLYLDADFISWNSFSSPEKGAKNFVGEFGGVKWMTSTAMLMTHAGGLSSGSTTALVSSAFTLVCGPECFGVTEIEGVGGYEVIVKRPNNADTSNPLNQWSTVGVKTMLAAAVLDKKRGYFVHTLIR